MSDFVEFKYPVYRIVVSWLEPGGTLHKKNGKKVQANNGNVLDIMVRDGIAIDVDNGGLDLEVSDFGQHEALSRAMAYWDKLRITSKNKPLFLHKLEVSFVGFRVWLPGWFHHTSLNIYPSEAEAFESFEKYVGENMIKHTRDEICLMGAEDRWRWRYCGCNECRRRGQTLITH